MSPGRGKKEHCQHRMSGQQSLVRHLASAGLLRQAVHSPPAAPGKTRPNWQRWSSGRQLEGRKTQSAQKVWLAEPTSHCQATAVLTAQ